jgi:hypothetical protein
VGAPYSSCVAGGAGADQSEGKAGAHNRRGAQVGKITSKSLTPLFVSSLLPLNSQDAFVASRQRRYSAERPGPSEGWQ